MQPKFMVIDDDSTSLALVKAILSSERYTDVELFEDSQKAQACYRANKYDILILDLRMPVLSGFDILNEMQETHSHEPNIIVITADATDGIENTVLNMGANKVFLKPFNVEDFIYGVNTLVNGLGSEN